MKIGFLSDIDFRSSGYFNISIALCTGLVEQGHDVKVIGFGYKGQEHNHPFSIIPSNNLMECGAIAQNLGNLWGMDVLIVALDIPVQEQFLQFSQGRKFKYIGLFPLEAPPLCMSWAIVLMQMDKQLVISKFGTDEINRFGIPAIHLPVGIDTEAWRMPEQEERQKIRKNLLGIDDDTFMVLTVADNQERKNLAAGMEAFSEFTKEHPKSVYVLVTREHTLVGWKLRDLAQELGISDKLMIYERGMSFKELWAIYASADVFMLPSKSEGLGLTLLESMATGVPSIGTDCTGIRESLDQGRGILVPAEYAHRDPFGNGTRWWINKASLVEALNTVYADRDSDEMQSTIVNARKYTETLDWNKSVMILCDVLKEIENGKEDKETSTEAAAV